MRRKRKIRIDGEIHAVPISSPSHAAPHRHLGLNARIFPPQNFIQQFTKKIDHLATRG
ncbi:MAG: hypothetical protein ACC608_06380 [Anaerofustis sp.]